MQCVFQTAVEQIRGVTGVYERLKCMFCIHLIEALSVGLTSTLAAYFIGLSTVTGETAKMVSTSKTGFFAIWPREVPLQALPAHPTGVRDSTDKKE
jgi:hypothetical protein